MKTIFGLLIAALAACAQPGAGEAGAEDIVTAIRDQEGAPADCAVAVSFGSYAMGIDRGAANLVEQLVAGDRGVVSAARHRWGREGEYTLCIQTRSDADAAALFGEIRPLLPQKPRGPIHVILRDGRRYDAPPR